MRRRKQLILGLGLAVASWVLVVFAVWCPIRALPALRRGLPGEPVDLAAVVGTVVVTVPLLVAGGYVGLRRLALDPKDEPAQEEEPQDP